jgi:hypothetical protein
LSGLVKVRSADASPWACRPECQLLRNWPPAMRLIDAFDTVIRCNSWRHYGTKEQTGSKVHVVFLNGKSMKHLKDNFEPGCLNVVVEQTKTQNNSWAVREIEGPVCTLSDKMWKDLKPYYDKATTGFLALCVALSKTSSVTILGMEGKGHLNAPKDRIWHGVDAEHQVHRIWAAQGRLHQATIEIPRHCS